jgi:hypothetical protein
MFSQEPESRTPLNFGLSALGALPFIPAAATIKAFHGTPHKVDKFSTDKIGTGEGAQSYGHGLYFAENEGVARGYQKKLESGQFHNQSGNVYEPLDELQNMNVRATLEKTDGDIDAAINRANEVIKSIPGTQGAEFAKADIPILEKLKVDGGLTRPKGSLYNVNLNVNPEDLLDWDAPLDKFPRKVLEESGYISPPKHTYDEVMGMVTETGQENPDWKYSAKGFPAAPTKEQAVKNASRLYEETADTFSGVRAKDGDGAKFYEYLTNKLGSQDAASQYLKDKGIKGIQYYDGMSRGRYGVMLKHKGKNYTDAPGEFATQKQADDYLKESIDKGFEAEHVDIGTRNYVMFDDNLIDIVDPIDDIVNKHNAALDSVK